MTGGTPRVHPELAARLESLEAERLRPVPAKPPTLRPAVSEAFGLLMDRLVQLPLGDEPDGTEEPTWP